MTVHMFRCFIGPGNKPLNGLENAVNGWTQNNAEWQEDTVPHTLVERNTSFDGTGETYYSIDARFILQNSKSNIQQNLANRLNNQVDWYRLGYHGCTHREGDGSSGACSWDDWVDWTAQGVTIPPGVPEFP